MDDHVRVNKVVSTRSRRSLNVRVKKIQIGTRSLSDLHNVHREKLTQSFNVCLYNNCPVSLFVGLKKKEKSAENLPCFTLSYLVLFFSFSVT